MDRPTTHCLAKFCVDQSHCFEAQDWLHLDSIDPKSVALAARYLSMTSWYGHEEILADIADRIEPSRCNDSACLCREAEQIGFDLPYFSYTVRLGLTQTRRQTQNLWNPILAAACL
ncbi:MAG: hypothetical protein KBD39_05765 [Sterolibacterium sp.]|nr:hypothetical protein [Sterolibacterium sp.]MBP9799609.1 hypothetical protein [Sterolibacterium sp.]